jgi:hypothetical protein
MLTSVRFFVLRVAAPAAIAGACALFAPQKAAAAIGPYAVLSDSAPRDSIQKAAPQQDTAHKKAAKSDTPGQALPGAMYAGTPSAPVPEFSGWIFGNYQDRVDRAPLSTCSISYHALNCRNFNEFTVDRAYLTFRTTAGPRASIRATLDVFQQTDTTKGANNFYKGWTARFKYAYFQYDYIKDPATLGGLTANARIGILHTVIIDHEETFWPRYLSQVALDREGWISSADVGAATTISFPHKVGEIYATVVNGSGYTSFETDRFKDYAARLTITPFGSSGGFLKTFDVTGWLSDGYTNSKFVADTVHTHLGAVGTGVQKSRWGGFAGIRDRRLTVAGEYAARLDGTEAGANTAASPDVMHNIQGNLVDGFVIVRPIEIVNPGVRSSVGLFFRADQYTINGAIAPKIDYAAGGLFWEPTSKTALSLDYQERWGKDGNATPRTQTYFLHFQAIFP